MLEINQNHIEVLHDYLEGRLSGDALQDVEQKLSEDSIFREQLDQLKLERKILKEHLKDQLRKEAKDALTQLSATQPKGSIRFLDRRFLSIAATLLLLVAAGFWLLNPNTSTEGLYAKYYEAPAPSFPRSNESGEEQYVLAMQDYSKQNVDGMIEKLSAIDLNTTTIDPSKIHFFTAIGYMEKNQFQEALNSLEDISSQSVLYPDAQWYRGLSLLGLGDIEACKIMLNTIAESNHYKQADAVSLLNALE